MRDREAGDQAEGVNTEMTVDDEAGCTSRP
jgi:hypothetical protein